MSTATATATAPAPAPAILFVAAGVPEEEIRPARFGGPLEVVRLAAGGDRLGQITRALAARRGLRALHILGVRGGGLDPAEVEAACGRVAGWGAALRADATIGLHGCGVGAGEAGWRLLGRLAALTGADVSASDEVTAASLLGAAAIGAAAVGADPGGAGEAGAGRAGG